MQRGSRKVVLYPTLYSVMNRKFHFNRVQWLQANCKDIDGNERVRAGAIYSHGRHEKQGVEERKRCIHKFRHLLKS